MNRSHVRANIVITTAMVACAAMPQLFAADLPKAETILDKYVEVTGGKAVYQKIHSQSETGTFEYPAAGLKGTVTSFRVDPDQVYTEIVLTGIGKMQDGSDGKTAW